MSTVIDKVKGKFGPLTNAVDRTQRKFKIMQRRSADMSRSFSKMGKSMRGVGTTMSTRMSLPLAAFGALSIKTATEFQGSMNRVEALTGETGKSLDDMRKLAMKLGASTQFSATQAADAMAFFGQAGFKANEIMQATPATLALAAASSTDLATSADILSNVMGGFNVKADQAGKFADVLAKATARGNINMEMIAETMKDAAPVAQKFGSSIEEAAALTAKLGDAGIQGSKAGTTLKNMFLNLSSPTERIKDIIGALGINVVDKTTGKMRSMTNILVDMNKAFQQKGIKGAKKLAILNEVFGKRAIAGAGVLLDAVSKVDATTGLNSVQSLTKELENSQGAAEKMANITQKGLPGAFKSLASAFEGVQLSILDLDFGGKKLSDRIVEIVGKVTSFLQSLSGTNKALLKWGVIIGAVLAVIGPFIATLGVILSMVPFMISGFNAIVVGLGFLKAAAIGTLIPMLPMIAAVGLLATAGVLLYKNWKPIKSFFADLFTNPLQQLKDMVGFIGQLPGLNKLFGDDTDAKLAAQGFKIQDAQGQETGSRVAVKESKQNEIRQRKAVLDVNFSNLPKDTKVKADDRDSLIGDLTGMMAIGG